MRGRSPSSQSTKAGDVTPNPPKSQGQRRAGPDRPDPSGAATESRRSARHGVVGGRYDPDGQGPWHPDMCRRRGGCRGGSKVGEIGGGPPLGCRPRGGGGGLCGLPGVPRPRAVPDPRGDARPALAKRPGYLKPIERAPASASLASLRDPDGPVVRAARGLVSGGPHVEPWFFMQRAYPGFPLLSRPGVFRAMVARESRFVYDDGDCSPRSTSRKGRTCGQSYDCPKTVVWEPV